jgi:hypothetical protein
MRVTHIGPTNFAVPDPRGFDRKQQVWNQRLQIDQPAFLGPENDDSG